MFTHETTRKQHRGHSDAATGPAPADRPTFPSPLSLFHPHRISNRHPKLLEIAASHRKQSSPLISNRNEIGHSRNTFRPISCSAGPLFVRQTGEPLENQPPTARQQDSIAACQLNASSATSSAGESTEQPISPPSIFPLPFSIPTAFRIATSKRLKSAATPRKQSSRLISGDNILDAHGMLAMRDRHGVHYLAPIG